MEQTRQLEHALKYLQMIEADIRQIQPLVGVMSEPHLSHCIQVITLLRNCLEFVNKPF